MEQLSKNRTAVMLIAVILFLALFALYMYLVQPAGDTIAEQESELSTLASQRAILQKKVDERAQKNDGFDAVAVQEALPLWDNTEQLLLDLHQIESITYADTLTANFTIEDKDNEAGNEEAIDTGDAGNGPSTEPSAMASAKKVEVSVTIKGRDADIAKYVYAVQNMKRLVVIDKFDISGNSRDSTKQITASLVFTAYFDPSYLPMVDDIQTPYKEYVPEDQANSRITESGKSSDSMEETPSKTQDATIGKMVDSLKDGTNT
ncbi:hypothetical protein ACFFSY_04650 [Paenibacillus aurantiacus]|uniref:Pilus assembly protein PilO n=1 Tax=Paenibacillus aurantiacus TaxID=1936118 RepID=A0ABV5KM78_9BACL